MLPLGYRYASTYAGIRKDQRDDLGLIVSEPIAQAAAIFTQNMVQAAPVRLARKNLLASGGKVAAILINAGNANCATRTGERVAAVSCKSLANVLKTRPQYVLPASTGVIGVELDAKLITGALPRLAAGLAAENFDAVARAMMTTDTRIKVASEEVRLAGGIVRVAGMTKGAGMIQPNMATTLGFVMTDASVPAKLLGEMLRLANIGSYSSLTVDGDTSTNDTLVLLANGAAGVKVSKSERESMQAAIEKVMERLAKLIAADGEGARKLIVVEVLGFKTDADARKVARAVSNSPLVKTAVAGSDANWGRILGAAGYAGVRFDPKDLDVLLQGVPVCRSGLGVAFDETDMKRKLDESEVNIRIVQRGRGKGKARFFTCDLTEGYIQINGSYRT